MKLIIFTGAPAGGKSSVAKEISAKTGIRTISKDECKIQLFEKFGFTNHDEKKTLSIRGEANMLVLVKNAIEAGQDIIVDNNFKDFDALRKVLHETGFSGRILCFVFEASYEKLAERYNMRIRSGNRHTALYCLNQYPVIDGVTEFHKPLMAEDVKRIQECIREETYGDAVYRINTDNIENEFDSICDNVISLINQE